MKFKDKLKENQVMLSEYNPLDIKKKPYDNNYTGIVLTSITFLIALTLVFPLTVSLALVVMVFIILFILEFVKNKT